MEDKTSEKNESQQQTKSAVERQADIIVSALERAKQNEGVLLNASMKMAPKFYPRGVTISPFNSLVLAMHSDANDYKTNEYTVFSEAKKRGESVRGGQTGVPFSWFAWNEYVNKNNPEDKLSRHDYKALPPEEQSQYKGIRSNEFRIVFNIEQTTMPLVNKEGFEKELHEQGNIQERDVSAKDDKKLRMDVNQMILNVRDNLVPIRKDGGAMAYYDKEKDAVHIPAQSIYASYPEYVQDVTRNVLEATAHPQRLNLKGSATNIMLVNELASAARQLEFGLPAKLSYAAMENIDNMIDSLKKNPKLIEGIERNVNSSLAMMKKAENGEKIELRPTSKDMDNWRKDLPKEGTVPDKFDAVLMLKDDDGKWALYVKPENEKSFAVHPEPKDVAMFFNLVKNNPTEKTETFRMELAQKYYADVAKNPDKGINLFDCKAEQAHLGMLERVNVFKTKDEVPKILMVPTITGGERLKAKELTPDQWQRMWLAPDMADFKKQLAGRLFSEELSAKLKQNDGAQIHQIPEWAKDYIVNGDASGLSDKQKQMVDKFLDTTFPDAFVPEVVEGKGQKMNPNPSFGDEPVNTVEIAFHPGGEMKVMSKEEEQEYQKQQEEEKKKNSPEQKEKEKQEEKAKEEATKQETKAIAKVALSPMLKQFIDLKKKHPDALLLFRCGDFYETYQKDAEKAAKILGITLTKSTKTKDQDGKPLAMAGFPYHALDTYLPKLIRAGERVAICDQIEAPKQTTKRGVTELLNPSEKQGEEKSAKEAPKVEEQETRSHGFHR